LCCVKLVSLAATQENQLPKRIQVSYEVTKNGQPFANVRELFVTTGSTYKVESITKGIGIYALFGERQLTSQGDVTELGLKPRHFELHQGDSAKKTLIADFDWANNTLHMLVKGVVKDAVLSLGSQDLVSHSYQFMFLPKPLKNTLAVVMTTGKKLNQYEYKISDTEEILDISGAQYKTLHLIQIDKNVQSDKNSLKTDTKELWLSVDHQYLPVKIIMTDDNGQKLEQTLTELHVE
jgi:Protein of unknown function (DUF3108)